MEKIVEKVKYRDLSPASRSIIEEETTVFLLLTLVYEIIAGKVIFCIFMKSRVNTFCSIGAYNSDKVL